jgi:diguanylate cyclase (GGDEF)-like protein/PAS domain S-box-containing protein
MQSKHFIILAVLLTFGWFFLVTFSEMFIQKKIRHKNLSLVNELAVDLGGFPESKSLNLYCDAFGVETITLVPAGGGEVLEGWRSSEAVSFESFFVKLGLVRQEEFQGEIILDEQSDYLLRATRYNRSFYFHALSFLLILLSGLIFYFWQKNLALTRLSRKHALLLSRKINSGEKRIFSYLTDLNKRLPGLQKADFSGEISNLLEVAGDSFEADQAVCFEFAESEKYYRNVGYWIKNGSRPVDMQLFKNVPIQAFSWWKNYIKKNKYLVVAGVELLPTEAKNEKYVMGLYGIKAMVAVPLKGNQGVWGFLALSRTGSTEPFEEVQVNQLAEIGEMCGGIWEYLNQSRYSSQSGLQNSLIKNWNHLMLDSSELDFDEHLQVVLRELTVNTRCDFAALFQFYADGSKIKKTHFWCQFKENEDSVKNEFSETDHEIFKELKARINQMDPWMVNDIPALKEQLPREFKFFSVFKAKDAALAGLKYKNVVLGFVVLARVKSSFAWQKEEAALINDASVIITDGLARFRSEKSLNQKINRQQALLSSLPDCVFRINENGVIRDVHLPGTESKERLARILGKNIFELAEKQQWFSQELLIRFKNDSQKCLADLKARSFQGLCQGSEDSLRMKGWLEIRLHPLNGQEWLCVFQDKNILHRREQEQSKMLANLLAIFDSEFHAVMILTNDLRLEAFNKMAFNYARNFFGKDIFTGMDVSELYAQTLESRRQIDDAVNHVLHGQEVDYEVVLNITEQRSMWFRLHFTPVFAEPGEVQRILLMAESLEKQKNVEKALRQSEERYALAVAAANDGMWDIDFVGNKVYFSDRWLEMAGLEKVIAPKSFSQWLDLVNPEDKDNFKSRWEAHLQGLTPRFECEYRLLNQNLGYYRRVLCKGLAVKNASGEVIRIAGSQTDVTEQREIEDNLLRESLMDPITALPNRAVVLDRLEHCQARAKGRAKLRYAVLFLDMDNFRYINDSFGHTSGNQLLAALARRLEQILRPDDTLGRVGGDEFAVIYEDFKDKKEVLQLVEKINTELKRPFHLSEQEVYASASIGVAYSEDSYVKAEDMLRDAETAMFQSKGKGPAQFKFFNKNMHKISVNRLSLETDLRKALAKKHFELYYQPVYVLETEVLKGFEALIRWNHPEKGLIMPADFIELAEETGLILPMGQWVLEQACFQQRNWKQRFPNKDITMAINLSARQLTDPGLRKIVQELVSRYQISSSMLELEITESMLVGNPVATNAILRGLKDLGVRLAIDDFGTGYSSLSYLHQFPIDLLKIDRSFVARMTGSDEQSAIVRTILSLAHTLNMETVAEGIETSQQFEGLRAMGCQFGQGYLFGKPLPVVQVEELLN